MEIDLASAVPVSQDNTALPASSSRIDLSSAVPANSDIVMKMSQQKLVKSFNDMRIWKRQAKPDIGGQAINATAAFVIDSTVNFVSNSLDLISDMSVAVSEKRATQARAKRADPKYNWMLDRFAFADSVDIAVADRNKSVGGKKGSEDNVFDRISKSTSQFLQKNFPQKPGDVNEWTYKLVNGGLSVAESYALMGTASALKASRLSQAMTPAFVIGAQQAVGVSEEAEAKGMPMGTRLDAYMQDFVAQGGIEAIGMDFLKNGLRGVKMAERVAIDVTNNAMQEGLQSLSEDGIRIMNGLSYESMSQVAHKAAENAVIGAIVGGGASAVGFNAENQGIVKSFRTAGFSDQEMSDAIDLVMSKDYVMEGQFEKDLMQKGLSEVQATKAKDLISEYGSIQMFKEGIGQIINDLQKRGLNKADAFTMAQNLINLSIENVGEVMQNDLMDMKNSMDELDGYEQVFFEVLDMQMKAGKPAGMDEITWATSAINTAKIAAAEATAEGKRRKQGAKARWDKLGVELKTSGKQTEGALKQGGESDVQKFIRENPNATAEEYVALYNVFHGTPADIEGGVLKFGAGKQLKKGGYMGGHFLTNSEEVAKTFQFGGKLYRASGEIKNKVFDVNKNKKVFKDFVGKKYKNQDGEMETFTKEHYDFMFPNGGDADWSTVYSDLAEQIARKQGKIGIAIPEYAGGTEGITYQIFDDNIPIKTKEQLLAEFNEAKGKILEQSAATGGLVAMHNIKEDGLIHADKMGGLAVPSLSIGKAKHPLEGFGEITLIGSKELIDPSRASTKVFNADIYSPRYPGVKYDIDTKGLKEARESVKQEEKDLGRQLVSDLNANSFDRKGKEALYESPILRLKYLRSVGKDVVVPKKAPKLDYLKLNPAIEKFVDTWNPPSDLYSNKEFIAEYKKLRQSVMDKARVDSLNAGNTVEDADADAKAYGEYWYEEDGNPNYNIIRQLMNEADEKKNAGTPDYYAADRLISDEIRKDSKAFQKWVDKNYLGIIGKERIYNGEDRNYNARYLAHTLENVVRVMKRELQGGENFNYGPASVRASVAKRYATIKQIQGDRDKVLSKEEFEKVKEISDQEFADIVGQAYDVAKNKDMGIGDRFTRVLIDGIKNRNISGELKEYGFEGMDIDRINAWLNNLRNMPTEYFEAKLQRAVPLSEFSGAVVPTTVSDEAIQVLDRAGIPYIKYDSNVEGDRARAIKEMSEKQDVLFQGKASPRAQVDLNSPSGKKIVTLFKKADPTSLVHEFAHIWFQDMVDYVNSGLADDEYMRHYSSVKNWLMVEDGQKILTREQQEKFAQGFESFLREGNAPINTDLQAAFAAFRKWMIKIYKDPKVLGEPLTQDMSDFFARMLGGSRAMDMVDAQEADAKEREKQSLDEMFYSYAMSLSDEEASLMELKIEQNENEAEPIRQLRDLLNRSGIKSSELDKGEWQDVRGKFAHFARKDGLGIDDLAKTWFSDHPRQHEDTMMEDEEFRQLLNKVFVEQAGLLSQINSETRLLKKTLKAREVDEEKDNPDDYRVTDDEILFDMKNTAQRIVDENLVPATKVAKFSNSFAITMKQWMRDREKAARGGFKAGQEAAADKYRDIINSLRWTITDIKRVKKDVSDYARAMLPASYGKRVGPLVNSANDQDGLIKAFIRINEMRDKYIKDSAINDLRDLIGKIASNESIDIGYKKKAFDLISDVELAKHTDETMERIAAMKAAVDSGKADTVTPEMKEEIDILSKRNIRSLTLSQIQGYKEKLEVLLEMGRTKIRVRKEARKLRKQVILSRLAGGTKAMEFSEERRIYGRDLTKEERQANLIDKLSNLGTRISMAITPIDVIFDELDGATGKFDGVNFRTFKSVIDASFGRYLDRKDAYQLSIIKLSQELGLDQKNFDRIGIYAVKQQAGGMQKLIATMTEEQVAEFEDIQLTENEMKWYLAARNVLDEMREPIAKVTYEEYNKNLDKVKNYFPFMTDWAVLSEAEIQERVGQYAEQAIEKANTTNKRNPRHGMIEKRVGGDQKINLNAFDVFMKHTDDVAYLVEMARDLRLLGEIAASPEYAEIAGDRGQMFVRSWIDLMARKGGVVEASKIAALDTIRRNIGVGTLGFKLTSMLVQPTSLADAAGRIGGDWVARGVNHILDPKWVRLIMQMPEIRRRAGDDPAYADFISGINGGDFIWMRKMQEAGMRPLQYLDMLSAMATAAGAYEKHMTEAGKVIDFVKIDQDEAQKAILDVRRTQSSGFFKDAPMMSTKGALTGNVSLDKFLAQFNNFIMNRFSTIHEVKAEFRRGDVQMLANRMTFFIVSAFAVMGVRGGISALKDLLWDDDKDYDFVAGFWNEILGNVPIVGNTVASWITGRPASVPIPGVSVIGDVMKAGSGIFSAKTDKTRMKNVIRAASSVGRIAGLPTLEVQDAALRIVDSSGGGRVKSRFKKKLKIRKIDRKVRRLN